MHDLSLEYDLKKDQEEEDNSLEEEDQQKGFSTSGNKQVDANSPDVYFLSKSTLQHSIQITAEHSIDTSEDTPLLSKSLGIFSSSFKSFKS